MFVRHVRAWTMAWANPMCLNSPTRSQSIRRFLEPEEAPFIKAGAGTGIHEFPVDASG